MPLTIGQVAKAADVNIETIRYYERRGLFPSPPRPFARYPPDEGDAVRRLKFVKRAQDLGFTLKEIEELLALRVHHGAACDAVEHQVRQKMIRVEQMLNDLRQVRDVLGRLADACQSRRPTGDCPILEILDDDAVASR